MGSNRSSRQDQSAECPQFGPLLEFFVQSGELQAILHGQLKVRRIVKRQLCPGGQSQERLPGSHGYGRGDLNRKRCQDGRRYIEPDFLTFCMGKSAGS